ncbi:PHB depolymerase family esterase [Jannaschia sp. S6380]|uniref:extracellular catalytic domain type 1 short-chain-length polyhydroxyalkanoate depolymerase n=1 Tax=Jannaschia sp. S6380 TaxID=2926408 RepID=UPI001FF370C3|nr:PHB depolymerase family esterase [Jannaschia sp. S6380]MCK0168458.1 PHB depolymerase family esterase [Jannaschia sp. S6380]
MSDMSEILNLVRTGRLGEATQRIQRNLGTGGPEMRPEPDMKDVTPRACPIPSPGMSARGKATRTKPARKPRATATGHPAGTTWARRQGPLPYRLSAPSAPDPRAPLLVMLHGCTQTPEDFAAGTGMTHAAGAIGAHVIWPEQTRAANVNACWNWFEPAHQGRTGEAAAIVTVIEEVLSGLGPRAVHVAGLSAGGAMAALLGAFYPDIVTSVAIHSGLAPGSAQDVGSAFAAMQNGAPGRRALAVPAIVFHGAADRTVTPANAGALLNLGPASDRQERREIIAGRRTTIRSGIRPGQSAPSEMWEIDGLGHAWSGGHPAGSYTDPKGPDATAEMIRFFAGVAPRDR